MTNQFSEIYQLVDQYYDITTELTRKEYNPKVYEGIIINIILSLLLLFHFFPSKLPGQHRRCIETVIMHATLHGERRVSVYVTYMKV